MISPNKFDLKQLSWDGKVCLCIEVCDPVSIGTHKYLLAIPRVTYLYLYLPKILKFFDQYLDHAYSGDWWFSWNGINLSPSKPIGVLVDMYTEGSSEKDELLPIQLHRGVYPSNEIMQLSNDKELKGIWSSQLKESCYINNGNSRAVMSMSQSNHELLWESIVHADRENASKNFWSTADAFLKPNLKVPIKVYQQIDGKWKMKSYPWNWESELGEYLEEDLAKDFNFVTHGIQLLSDFETKIVYNAFAYPDGFLHLVMKNK